MKKLLHCYNKLEEYLLVGSLVVLVSIIFFQVVMRYVFNSALSWSEELARYIYIWQIWLGVSLGVKESKHIRVEIIYGFFKGRSRHLVDIIALSIFGAFCIFLSVSSFGLIQDLIQKHALSASLRIPLAYAYASVPVGCGLTVLRLVEQIYSELISFWEPEGGKV